MSQASLPIQQTMPYQWSDCCIDYPTLHLILKQMQITTSHRLDAEKLLIKNQGQHNLDVFEDMQINAHAHNRAANTQTYLSIKYKNQKQNTLFLQTLKKQLQMLETFANFKIKQIEDNFNKAVKYAVIVKQQQKLQKEKLLPYLQCLYIQICGVLEIYDVNVGVQKKINFEYNKAICGYYKNLDDGLEVGVDIIRCLKVKRQIQELYVKNTKEKNSVSRNKIRQLSSKIIRNEGDLVFIGIFIGIVMTKLIFLIVILLYLPKQDQTVKIFKSDFPLWGGVILLLLYNWVLGINLYHYKKYKINYPIIFQFNHTKYPSSPSFFKPAAFFSLVTLILFILYTLDLLDIIVLKNLNPQMLSLFIWVPYGFYVLNPVSMFYYKSRTYMVKILIKCLISVAIRITYQIVYTSDQFLSAFVPIHAAFFSSCYYTRFQGTNNNQQLLQQYDCLFPTYIAIFVVLILLFLIRIIQCIKLVFQSKPYNISEFVNSLKYVTALFTAILSFSLNDKNRQVLLPLWVVFFIVTVGLTYLCDIKYDWLLVVKMYKVKLRNILMYGKIFYYCVLFFNIFLRACWVLTISPNIIYRYFSSPQMCIFIFAFLELIRRGVWNMLSVQAQHVKNCKSLSILPKSFYQLDLQIYKTVIENKSSKLSTISIERLEQPDHIHMNWEPTTQHENKQKFKKIQQKVSQKRNHNKKITNNMKVDNKDKNQVLDYLFNYV